MDTPTVAAVAIASVAGAVAVPWLTVRGLQQLHWREALPRRLRLSTVLVGAATTAVVTGFLFVRVGWALLPAYVVWACALVALAVCDGLTQRIPTPLVRQSTIVVSLALLAGAVSAADWTLLLAAAAWTIASAFALLLAWHFAGTGFGDVRLGVLGGLGLAFANPTSLLLGLGAWAALATGQAMAASARGGSLRTRVALGPGLATAFLVAACIPT